MGGRGSMNNVWQKLITKAHSAGVSESYNQLFVQTCRC
jgi:hypothetical protein